MIDTKELREAIQTFGSQAINEGDLNELLDRLELAESKEASYKKAFEISENTIRDLTEKVIPNIRNKLEVVERDITLKERIIDSLGSTLNAVSNERDVLRDRLALESQENGALRDSVDRACEERDELRTELKEVRHGVAVAHDVINTLRARIEAAEKEVAHIKEVEFPRKVRVVAVGWETKCARLKQERDELCAKIEAAEKERDWNAERLEEAIEECTALRAKLETAENDAAHQKALAASALQRAGKTSATNCAPRSGEWSDRSHPESGGTT